MFDIGAAELLVIIIVAVIVIGPKDLPLAMRVAGRWIGKMRRISAHFRSGIDTMVREAELEDMEKQWKAQNEEIMRRSAALTAEASGADAGAAQANAAVPAMSAPLAAETPSVAAPCGPPLEAPTAAPAKTSPPRSASDV